MVKKVIYSDLEIPDPQPYDRSAAMAEDETNMDQQYYPAVDWFCLKLGCWLHMLMTGGVLASLLYDDIKQNGLWIVQNVAIVMCLKNESAVRGSHSDADWLLGVIWRGLSLENQDVILHGMLFTFYQ
eukprot:g81425.t1